MALPATRKNPAIAMEVFVYKFQVMMTVIKEMCTDLENRFVIQNLVKRRAM